MELLTGFQLVKNQYSAMLMKICLSILRTWILQLIQISIPVLFLIITIVVTRNSSRTGDLPELSLTLNSYDNPITLLEVQGSSSVASSIYETMLKAAGHSVNTVANITENLLALVS